MTDRLRGRPAKVVLCVVTALLLVGLLAPTALGMTRARVTVDRPTGGQPTRFTFQATTEADAAVASIDFQFEKGFNTDKAEVRATRLEGLQRIETAYTFEVLEDGHVKVTFAEPVPPESNLFIEVYNIMTPIAGGEYTLPVAYEAVPDAGGGADTRTIEGLTFRYKTPPVEEAISRWMDEQAWVEAWNSVKFFDLFLKPQQIVRAIPLLFTGWLMSLALVLVAFPISIVTGLLTSFMKMAKIPPVRWIAAAYINIIRGTPLFLQIFIAFIGLRAAGFRVPDFFTAVAVLVFNSSAYLAEIFRAGIQSISKGQFEAASSLGMTYPQAMQHVIIPQTVKRVLPTTTSEFILLYKDTALLAAIGLFELMMKAKNFVALSGNLSAYVVAAGYYLIITIPLINVVSRLEARLAQSEHGVAVSPRKRGRSRGVAKHDGPPFDATAASHESR